MTGIAVLLLRGLTLKIQLENYKNNKIFENLVLSNNVRKTSLYPNRQSLVTFYRYVPLPTLYEIGLRREKR